MTIMTMKLPAAEAKSVCPLYSKQKPKAENRSEYIQNQQKPITKISTPQMTASLISMKTGKSCHSLTDIYPSILRNSSYTHRSSRLSIFFFCHLNLPYFTSKDALAKNCFRRRHSCFVHVIDAPVSIIQHALTYIIVSPEPSTAHMLALQHIIVL